MNPFSTFRLCLLALTLSAAAPDAAAQGLTMAQDFARLQDLSSSPPSYDSYLNHLFWFMEPNGSILHLGGPPFPPNGPWYLPPNLMSYSGTCKAESETVSEDPYCVRTCVQRFVTLTFTDGSRYSIEDTNVTMVCSDGSSERFRKVSQVAEIGPSGARESMLDVESWARENTVVQRQRHLRASQGAVAAWPDRNGAPIVDGGPLGIELAPGAVLDLRQNPAANGPLFVTDGPVLLRCDQILMDPGVQLPDLFSQPPILQPGQAVVELLTPGYSIAKAPTFPLHVDTSILNIGNSDAVVQASWSGGYAAPGQTLVPLVMGQRQEVGLDFTAPPGTPLGAIGRTSLNWLTIMGSPSAHAAGELVVVHDHPGVLRFGAGSPGCLGLHQVDIDGPLEAGGPLATMTVTANNPFGIGVWVFGDPVAGSYGMLPLPGGVALYVDPFGAWFANEIYLADGTGVGAFVLGVPADPAVRGLTLCCQPIGLWLGPCNPGVLSFSSGGALQLQVQ